ncbi:aquaporin-8 [Lingula anatina]|uniref:Aquaporin-8 n=1 Tax=Lingula anatina TaxID=7574 RepID=A0A1S3K4M4_LINAN|nr:aquaporin-8 [Lingula anatina]XP_023933688.1 aquaporin-8 [Lingula anatina]|eukprot:XP_013417580.1 aquaporin-8 [Lingula anatina]
MTSHALERFLLSDKRDKRAYESLPSDPSHAKDGNNMSAEKEHLINESGGEATEQDVVEKYVLPGCAEFVATLLFVFVGCMAAVGTGSGPIVNVALAHGLTIALVVASFGHISGAHVNPAVTLGIVIAGGITLPVAVVYLFAQLLGGMVGAGFVRLLSPVELFNMTNGGAQTINPSVVTWGTAIGCEIFLTIVLVFTILMVAVDSKTNKTLAPIIIGVAVVVCILAGGWLSGASMNPARTFGPAVAVTSYNPDIWKYHYIYWVGPFLGACVSGLLYRLVFASPDKRVWRR